jgi:hypothetical protein
MTGQQDSYSVTIKGDALTVLRYLARIQGITVEEALGRAIVEEEYFAIKRKEGYDVFVHKDDTFIKVMFPPA